MKTKLATVLMSSLMLASITQANLLQNADFEAGTGTLADNWSQVSNLGRESWAAESGTFGMAFYAWTDANWGFFSQDVPIDLANGNIFTFEINGFAEANYDSSTSETYLQVEFWVDGEGAARETFTFDIYDAIVGDPGNWNTYSFSVQTTDPQVNLAKPVVGFGAAVADGSQDAAFFDNATFTQVPEPSAFAFLAVGMVCALQIRRRLRSR